MCVSVFASVPSNVQTYGKNTRSALKMESMRRTEGKSMDTSEKSKEIYYLARAKCLIDIGQCWRGAKNEWITWWIMENGNGRFSMCSVPDNGEQVIANVLRGKWFYFHFVLLNVSINLFFLPLSTRFRWKYSLRIGGGVCVCVWRAHTIEQSMCSCGGKCWRVRMPSLRSFDWDTVLYIGKFVRVRLCGCWRSSVYVRRRDRFAHSQGEWEVF